MILGSVAQHDDPWRQIRSTRVICMINPLDLLSFS
jgi:hypothetical protein